LRAAWIASPSVRNPSAGVLLVTNGGETAGRI
jgi:hypothetical protein